MAGKKKNEAANAAPQQAKQPVPKVSVPSRASKMTKVLAEEQGLDASVFGKIKDK